MNWPGAVMSGFSVLVRVGPTLENGDRPPTAREGACRSPLGPVNLFLLTSEPTAMQRSAVAGLPTE
jgi:hypothetical protein